jgi:phosphatidylinositol glycan class B
VTAPHISKGKWQNLLPYIATMLWWIPFFHARTTAENFGTMTAQLALVSIFFFMPAQLWQSTSLRTFLSKKGAWAPPPAMALLGGFLIGLAFNLRIPLVAVVPFIALWAIFSRLKISSLILIILGVLIAIGATILTDYWGYGRWTYSTYNWFWWELVHGVSKQFGTDPWWAYLTKISSRAIPPISILLLISFIWFWIKYPFHLLTWVTFSFFVAHSAMGHKEMRFMFPLSAFAPFIVCQTLYDLEHGTFFKKLFNGIWWKILSSIFISINIIAMLYSSLIPAYSGISLYKFLYKQQQTITQLNTIGVVRDPLYFYMKVPFTNNLTDDPQKIEQVLNQQSLQNKYFLATRWQQRSMIEKYPQCVSVFQSRPQWVIDLMPEKMLLKSEVFSLFSCQ